MSWSTARIMRAAPPSLAAKGARRRQFAAGLEQGEELWRAAVDAAPTVKPILLFYGLTQASRALTAARVVTPDWQGKTGHGLRMSDPVRDAAATNAYDALDGIVLTEHGNGFFQQVAGLIGSATLPGATTLHDLLLTVNEGGKFALPADHPRPTEVAHRSSGPVLGADVTKLTIIASPLPERIAAMRVPSPPLELRGDLVPTDEVAKWLANYPRLTDLLGRPTGEQCSVFLIGREWDVHLTWTLAAPLRPAECGALFASVCDQLDPDGGRGTIRPGLTPTDPAPEPLVAWWAVLYALSMLARYHPEDWLAMLDVDRSQVAVPLEAVLAVAECEVPSLLVDAIDSGEQQG